MGFFGSYSFWLVVAAWSFIFSMVERHGNKDIILFKIYTCMFVFALLCTVICSAVEGATNKIVKAIENSKK